MTLNHAIPEPSFPEPPKDPKWQYPELPQDNEPRESEPESSDEGSLYDDISERSASPNRSIWDVDQAKRPQPHKKAKPQWSHAEDALLIRLRTTTSMCYDDITKHFPGRRTKTIYARWWVLRKRHGIEILKPYEEDRREKVPRGRHPKLDWSHIEDRKERARAICRQASKRYR